MTNLRTFGLAAILAAGMTAQAGAVTLFTSSLDEAQEVSGVNALMPTPSGTATLSLNDAMTELMMTIELVNLDLDGAQTAAAGDDVTAFHIHDGDFGTNGGVVFNIGSSASTVVDAVAGTVSSTWTGLSMAQATDLKAGGFYFNFHTVATGSGQIRGQILPQVSAPATLALAAGGLALVGLMRRRG